MNQSNILLNLCTQKWQHPSRDKEKIILKIENKTLVMSKLHCTLDEWSNDWDVIICMQFCLSSYSGVGGGINNACTMHCNVDGALNSLSTSKDGSQVVVAGRNGKW